MKHLIASGALAALSFAAAAHDGHGMSGAHWHASDSVGYLLLAGVAAAAVWFARRK